MKDDGASAAILDALQAQHIWQVACRTGFLGCACAPRTLEVHSKTLEQLESGYGINRRDGGEQVAEGALAASRLKAVVFTIIQARSRSPRPRRSSRRSG